MISTLTGVRGSNYMSPIVTHRRTNAEIKSEKFLSTNSIARKSAEIKKDAIDDLNAEEEYSSGATVAKKSTAPVRSFKRVHCSPVHVSSSPSPLSTEAEGGNYRGFINLTILLLVVNMLRLAIENIKKYGILLSIPGKHVPWKDYGSFLSCLLVIFTCIFIAWLSEQLCFLRSKNSLRNKKSGILTLFAVELIFVNVILLLILPAWIIWTHAYHPVTGFITLLTSVTLTMKLVSYHSINYELRRLFSSSKKEDHETLKALYPECVYPENLTLGNIFYFWCAPTLCYQPAYPRIPKIRKMFLFKRLCEAASALVGMYVMIEQYAVPTVRNSLKPMEESDWVHLIERILKLSTTSLYVWLLGFYAFFHSCLNATAEILRFGDRGFYKDWWNAQTLDEYWRLWNAPVHFWLKRHVYIPLRSSGYSPFFASLVIFGLSAIGHEYLVAVSTHLVLGWALGAMLAQVPLIAFTRWYLEMWPKSSFGNYFFWVTFCILGMPTCVLFYYRAWIQKEANGLI